MIGLVGLDHRLASVDVRGRLALADDALVGALGALAECPALGGAVILSTCNRTEVYVATADWRSAREVILGLFASLYAARLAATTPAPSHLPNDEPLPAEIARELYIFTETEAARHLCTVAAGLRSMVVGEAQILGQVKDAMLAAEQAGTLDEELRAAFTAALKAGKRVRTETDLGRTDLSVAHLAMGHAGEALGGLEGKAVLLIGAGRTSQLCARIARNGGASRLLFANRTPQAAAALAQELGGEALPLAEVPRRLAEVNLVVSATAAPHVILTAHDVAAGLTERASAGRMGRLIIVDLAVPVDVAPEVAELPAVTLYTLDTLLASADADSVPDGRDAELVRAGQIVEESIRDYVRAQTMRLAVPGIAALRRHVDHSAEAELERALDRLRHLGPADQEIVARLSRRLVDKMFHHLVARVRSLAEYDEVPPQITMQVLTRLLADPETPPNASDTPDTPDARE